MSAPHALPWKCNFDALAVGSCTVLPLHHQIVVQPYDRIALFPQQHGIRQHILSIFNRISGRKRTVSTAALLVRSGEASCHSDLRCGSFVNSFVVGPIES